MALPVIYLILGLILLIKGADLLVAGAVSIARRLQVSDLVIGLTVVAFGTSTPELFVNLLASFKAHQAESLPRFFGGLVGYLGYDMVKFMERLPDTHEPLDLPDSSFMVPRTVLIHDSFKQKLVIVNCVELKEGDDPEKLYHNAYAEELESRSIFYRKEQRIPIVSPKTGKKIGSYQPDFVVDDKIIVELKAKYPYPQKMIDQLYDYLRNSKYELGYFINFASPKLYVKRIIYTNDQKPKIVSGF